MAALNTWFKTSRNLSFLVRLGTRSPNEFIQEINKKNADIQEAFISQMSAMTKTVDAKVMMGDSTVTEQKTFDPKQATDYFQRINGSLGNWSVQDVSVSNNEDIRRVFTKFETAKGNYLLSGHLSVQFHVLLYYRPDQRVLDCQKELAEIVDLTKNTEQQISDSSDQFVLNKLKEMGYKDLDHQKLFEIFYKNDEFRDKVYAEIEKDAGVDFQQLLEKKTKLLSELDSLLVETYQVAPVLIDENRLVTGEEGFLCSVDLEFVKNKNREGLFDPRKMPDTVKEDMLGNLEQLEKIIKDQGTGR